MIKKNYKFLITLLIFFSFSANSEEILFELKADKVVYKKNLNEIIADGNAIAWDKNNRKLTADKIIYNKNTNFINSTGSSKFEDKKIIITADFFTYDIKKNIISAKKNVVFLDIYKNKYKFEKFNYNDKTKISFGYNAFVELQDGSSFKSKYVEINQNTGLSFYKNSNYTTCKNIKNNKNEYCPTWSLNSKLITHDNNEKKIIHKNTFLKFQNIPTLYTPYLSHPDPSVKRQSGFLPPLVKSISNIGRTVKIPYFWALSEDRDLTFTPIYYFKEKSLFNATYRQAFKDAFLHLEGSYSEGYKNYNIQNRTSGSRNYFFLKYDKEILNEQLNKKNIYVNLQNVSQKNYLRVNKINTKLFKEDQRILTNNILYDSISNNKQFQIGTTIFENLDEIDKNKYTYILPEGSYSFYKKLSNDFNSSFSTSFSSKKFLDNQKQNKILNNFKITSKQLVNNYGISSIFKINILNNNIYNNNVVDQEGGNNLKNYMTVAYDSSLPFSKSNNLSSQTIVPRIFTKYTTGHTGNNKNKNKILEYYDIFSLNRSNNYDNPETGFSIGYGIGHAYKKKDFNNNIKIKSDLSLGQIIKTERDENMPNQSSLNNSSSDFVGLAKIAIYGDDIKSEKNLDIFKVYEKNLFESFYKFNLNSDLKKFARNQLALRAVYNKFLFNTSYEEQNTHIGSERLLETKISKLFKDNLYIDFKNIKDLKTNNNRTQSISLNYENDCILTSFSFNRNFYTDEDIVENKTLMLSITIKPFGDSIAPDISNLVN